MRKTTMTLAVVSALLLALVVTTVASAHTIRRAYMRAETMKTARATYNGLQDSTSFGVNRCKRFTQHTGKCAGVIRGASTDPANPTVGPQAWTCVFIQRFKLVGRFGVDDAIGAVQCEGPGEPFIK